MVAAPQNIQAWNSYLIGVYFTDNFDLTHEVLDAIFNIHENPDLEEDKKPKPYELCELHLFRAHLHEKKGDVRKAIKYMEKKSKVIVDEVRRAETLARLYLTNKQTIKALEQVHKLLALNQTNKAYFYRVLDCKDIDYNDPANIDKVVEALQPYQEQYPKSNTPLRIVLRHAPADSPVFKETLIKYLRPQLIKGVPSVINDLKVFYKEDPAKAAILGTLLDEMSASMEECMCLSNDDEEELDPTVQLWLYLFQSQHYMRYAKHGGPEYYTKSMEYVNKAIEHTPTVIELYIHKAKLYQQMGNQKEAAKLTEEARNLDLADRYLNAHSSKYLFKNDKI